MDIGAHQVVDIEVEEVEGMDQEEAMVEEVVAMGAVATEAVATEVVVVATEVVIEEVTEVAMEEDTVAPMDMEEVITRTDINKLKIKVTLVLLFCFVCYLRRDTKILRDLYCQEQQ